MGEAKRRKLRLARETEARATQAAHAPRTGTRRSEAEPAGEGSGAGAAGAGAPEIGGAGAGRLSEAPVGLTPAVLEAVGMAVRQVVTAVSSIHGADCILYALVGAELLTRLGHPARAVAGSAAWRIGPGDGDVLSHAHEISGPRFVPSSVLDGSGRPTIAGMFHAWVEVEPTTGPSPKAPEEAPEAVPAGARGAAPGTATGEGHREAPGVGPRTIADFTTWQIPRKARELDQADGGTTTVAWAPPYLWVPARSARPFRAVAQAADAGVYGYVRHAEIERLVYTEGLREEARGLAGPAWMAYRAARDGHRLRVFGASGHGDALRHAVGATPDHPVQEGLVEPDDPAALDQAENATLKAPMGLVPVDGNFVVRHRQKRAPEDAAPENPEHPEGRGR